MAGWSCGGGGVGYCVEAVGHLPPVLTSKFNKPALKLTLGERWNNGVNESVAVGFADAHVGVTVWGYRLYFAADVAVGNGGVWRVVHTGSTPLSTNRRAGSRFR